MSWTPKIFATLAVAVLIGALALWLGGFFGKPPAPPSPPASVANAPAATNAPRLPPRTAPIQNRGARLLGALATETNQIADWQGTIDTILQAEAEPEEKGAALLMLWPRFPADAQDEAAQHLANLLADEDYEPFGLQLANTNTAPLVQDIIFADLLGRSDQLKLPILLEVAKTPDHPKAAEAKDILELYLEKNYGNDWDTWKQKLDEWLRDNPN